MASGTPVSEIARELIQNIQGEEDYSVREVLYAEAVAGCDALNLERSELEQALLDQTKGDPRWVAELSRLKDSMKELPPSESQRSLVAPPVIAPQAGSTLVGRSSLLNVERPSAKGSENKNAAGSAAVSGLGRGGAAASSGQGRSGSVTMDALVSLGEALQYDGFNTVKFREKLKQSKQFTWKVICECIVAYCMAGNNYARALSKSRSDQVQASNLSQKLAGLGISPSKTASDSITLQRIAASFATLLLAIRKGLAKKSLCEDRVPDTCDAVWQDASLAGFPKKPRRYGDFHAGFGKILAEAAQSRKTDVELEAESMNWIKVAMAGFEKDPVLMKTVSEGDINKLKSAFGY